MDNWELKERQKLPLSVKIKMSENRIKEWYNHFNGKVYISFSGGKDSTVLLNVVRNIFPEVPAVFIDTGLEYPEIRNFVKTIDNVTWIKPKKTFKEVITKYGYPVVSKEQSLYIYQYRNTKSDYMKNLRFNGSEKGHFKISEKWKYLINAPFKISDKCCYHLKKSPINSFENKTGLKPFVGVMASDSRIRQKSYLKNGCNSFSTKKQMSRPLSFWLERDIWKYIHNYKLPYSTIYNMGYDRTGCMFCMFGIQNDVNRFEIMKKTHPAQYKLCIENLGCGKVLNFMNIKQKN